MIPLLFAAAVAGAPASPSITAFVVKGAETPACAKLLTQTAAPDGTPFKKLDELPEAVQEHAVWRTVGGCPVREVVWQGQTYYVGSSNPVLDSGPLTGNHLRRYDHVPDNGPDGPGPHPF
jgi:hypothetical protein